MLWKLNIFCLLLIKIFMTSEQLGICMNNNHVKAQKESLLGAIKSAKWVDFPYLHRIPIFYVRQRYESSKASQRQRFTASYHVTKLKSSKIFCSQSNKIYIMENEVST